ncbi:glycosyltransferase family 2 protein [Methylobacillus flagellatus]|uniref:glycosyltransferase family 2 protein n=1 Tax=Methylobacillus flagellatus TaxID=405 RepID=UPI0010F5EC60|nr:glycosyltransferase family 2 protein [Methylobacillus flagellatus]
MNWQAWVEISQWLILLYFISMNCGYLLLNLFSLRSMREYISSGVLHTLPQPHSGLEPAVSILVPAYNEQATIAGSLLSMLQLSYPNFEIVVINDGSKDDTLEVLKREFALAVYPEDYDDRIATKPIRGIYRSTRYPNLRVIDKENGGKADSLNAGINAARHPLFCGVDADTVLQRDSMQRIVQPFLDDNRVVATGGTVRIANGCEVSGGYLTKIGLPRNLLALFQVVEYLRAFLFGRLGWSSIQGLLIISGAFGVFKRDVVQEIGGYRTDTVGEDMELVVRMHRLLREQGRAYRIVFLPDPVCWTEAPEDLRTLRNQRIRWQRGLSESLSSNFGLMLSRKGGVPGWVTFPFMMIFEWLGPLLEVLGYVLMVLFFIFDMISWQMFAIFMFATFSFGVLLSLSGLLLEEISFSLYKKPQHLLWLILAVIVENFGYRQLNSIWRLRGLFRWAIGTKHQWGDMKRKASWQQS